MRSPARISLALGTSAALLSLAALPASAAEETPAPSQSETTVKVEAGTLSISLVPEIATDVEFKPGTTAEIPVPAFTVMDNRAGTADWNVAVELSNFVGQEAGISEKTIDATLVTYKPAMVGDVLGEATVSVAAEVLSFESGKPTTAVNATGVVGNNTASWNGTLSVPVPGNALAGTYKATLTHSFL